MVVSNVRLRLPTIRITADAVLSLICIYYVCSSSRSADWASTDIMRPDSHTCFFFFSFCFLGDFAFFRVFLYHAVFPLYGEYVVRFFLPDDVFPPFDHGLDFFTSTYVKIQSVQSSMIFLVVCMVTHIARVWINRVRLPILLVFS